MSADELPGRLLIDIAIVLATARLFGLLLRRLRQPAVLGEIIAGIAVGPTVLGALPGDPSTALFPDQVREGLTAIGGLGLVLFMLLAGLETPRTWRSFWTTAHALRGKPASRVPVTWSS